MVEKKEGTCHSFFSGMGLTDGHSLSHDENHLTGLGLNRFKQRMFTRRARKLFLLGTAVSFSNPRITTFNIQCDQFLKPKSSAMCCMFPDIASMK